MQFQAYPIPMDSAGHTLRILWLCISVSMISHLFFIILLIIVPDFKFSRPFSTPVIDVNLVNLPPPPASPPERQQHPAASETKSPEAAPRPVKETPLNQEQQKKEAISIAPKKPRVKTSLKKETFKPANVLKNAVSEIEKTVDQSRTQTLKETIDRLKSVVSDDVKGIGTTEGDHTSSKKPLELMDIYKAEIPYHIQKNWAFSEQLAGEDIKDLVAWMVIEIKSDGQISDIWFEKRSGNRYFDDQAYKAVVKSNPLPPLPKEYSRPLFNVGLRFTPSGLR